MPLQAPSELAQRLELFNGEIARMGQGRVKGGRRMALGHDEAVAVLFLRVPRVVIQHAAEVERREDVDAGEEVAGVLVGTDAGDAVINELAESLRELGVVGGNKIARLLCALLHATVEEPHECAHKAPPEQADQNVARIVHAEIHARPAVQQ